MKQLDPLLRLSLALLGVTMIFAGCWWHYPPLALVVVGGCAFGVAILAGVVK